MEDGKFPSIKCLLTGSNLPESLPDNNILKTNSVNGDQ